MTKKVVVSVVNNEEIVSSNIDNAGEVPSRKCRLFGRFTSTSSDSSSNLINSY